MSNISATMFGQRKYVNMFSKCPACGVVVYRGLHNYCPLCNHSLEGEESYVNSDIQNDSLLTSGAMDSGYDRIEQDVKEVEDGMS